MELDVEMVAALEHLTALTLLTSQTPLDLSPLTTLETLETVDLFVQALPSSLKSCTVALQGDVDLSGLTRLSHLAVQCQDGARVTFPTQLGHLEVSGAFPQSNIGDVHLKSFFCHLPTPLTDAQKAQLPSSLETTVIF